MCVSSYAENRVTAEEKDYINQNHAFREAIRRAQEGDRNARDELVQNNIGLVRSIVYRFRNRGYEAEDLFQVGCIGLIKAIDHFDLTYDVRFSTYAVPLITGEIRRFLRDDGMLKVSRTLKQQALTVNRAAEQWRNAHGREAALEELSAQTGIPTEDIVLAISANAEVDSLYRRIPGDAGREITLQEQIRDEKNEIEMRLNHVFLEQALAARTKEERQLISLRYFHRKTQTETAKTLGMTQVQVSRKEKKLLLKMRAME
ncbi:MAG: sigma-70 family RNA polymerase sigma factor [Clostridiales bacterium]|nr:sigma-70 family RNA polymerase sigma factor [Clostridiales bacterium]